MRDSVRQRRVDRQLGEVAQDALVVVRRVVTARSLRHVSELPGPAGDFADTAHAHRVRAHDRDGAEVVEHALGRHRPAAHATACRQKVVLEAWVQAVHRADHLLVLGDGAGAEGDGGVGRGGQDVVAAHDLEQVHGAAAAALDVVAVHRPVADRGERLLERRRLADAVGMQGQLHVVALGDGEGGVDDLGVRTRVLVYLEAACPHSSVASRKLSFAVAARASGRRLSGTARQASSRRSRFVRGLTPEVERAAVAHGDERRGTPRERRSGDLRPEQVDVRVDRAGRRDEALGRDDARRRGQGTATPSIVSGFPARPTATMRPSLIPSDVLRMPRTGSSRTTFVTATSRASSGRMLPVVMSPSRIVFAKPTTGSAPGAVSSASTSSRRSVSPRRTRSPAVGP